MDDRGMEYVDLSDGTRIPALGFGTYRMMGRACERAVRLALEAGYRHIDTAQIYENQPAIGRAIQGIPRQELYLTSKLWVGEHTKERVPLACDTILQELGVDYVDLLLIHWPDRTVPISETLGAMEQLRVAGKVRSLGMSNCTERHLSEALAVGVKLVVNQVECHVFFPQEALGRFCAERGVALTAYTPLAKGAVADDQVLAAIGAKYDKTGTQVAIRWLLDRRCVVIPKTATPERIRDNFDVFDFGLDREDTARIDRLDTGRRLVCPSMADFEYR